MKKFALLLAPLVLVACQSSVVDTTAEVSSSSAAASSEAAMVAAAYTGTRTTVDASQSTLTFVGGSSIIDHDGKFDAYTVTITPSAETPSDFTKATVAATIDLTSAKTDSQGLDGHLQKADFFDTANHAEATFTSTSILQDGDANHYDIVGDLTIKGVTKSITIEATVTDDGIEAEFEIPRKDYGIGNDSYGDKLLDEQIPVKAHLVFQA